MPIENLASPSSPWDIAGLTGEPSGFGAWLADQISSALVEAGQPVVGRDALSAALRDRNVPPQDWLSYNSATIIAKSVGADAILVGTMSAIQDHIGLTLTVYSFTSAKHPKHPSPVETIAGELTITEDIRAHLGAPLDSFSPKDGLYTSGEGGIGMPKCVHCPDPSYTDAAARHRIEGTVVLIIVVTPEGRATQIEVTTSLDQGLDENAIGAIKKWKFEPATDLKGNPVSVLVPVKISFRL